MILVKSPISLLCASVLLLAGCSGGDISSSFMADDAQVAESTKTGDMLKNLPLPKEPVVLAVYNFDDKTGQQKPSENFPEYSRAVTQGGAAILSKALYDAGNGRWFTVLEREGLNNLVQERKIIRATRAEYSAPGEQISDIGPMLYAGVLIEGGIVAYESNTITGGAGARYLGIGGDTQYRRDVVTVALRAVGVQSGQVLVSVNSSKTIFSTVVNGGVNKFVAIDKLLEVESGFSVNEPPQLAVRQAVEMSVYSMIVEGAAKGLWSFADPSAGQRVIESYYRKNGVENAAALQAPPKPISARPEQQPSQRMMEQPPQEQELPSAPTQAEPMMSAPFTEQQPVITTPPAKLRQLPEDAKPNPQAPPGQSLEESGAESLESMQPYRQRGVVYCGPSGCVPSYEPPSAQ